MAAKKADGVSDRYQQCLRYCIGKFAVQFRCNIGAVTSVEIDDWLRKSGLSPRSRNNLRNSVQTLFSFAKKRRYLPKDHDEIESVTVVKDRDGAIEVFTPAELVEVLNHAGERLIPFFTIGAFAGIRHAEIQRLEWKDIRFEDGIIEIHAAKAKTASRRTVPMLDNLRLWLMAHRQESGLVCAYRSMDFEIRELVRRINRDRRTAWAKANGVGADVLRAAGGAGSGAREQSQGQRRSSPGRGAAGHGDGRAEGLGCVRVEAQRVAAFVHQLPGGRHSECESSGAGSGEQSADDLPALPGTGADGGCQSVVWN